MEKTILLIHGYGFDFRTWYPIDLAFEGFRVIHFSLPGFGSKSPSSPYTIEGLAKDFWSSPKLEGLSSVHLVGHSMGGYVCIEMAAQQPSRVASLALIQSHVFEDDLKIKEQRSVSMENIRTQGREQTVRKVIPSLFAPGFNAPEIVETLVTRGMSYDDDAWRYGAQAMRDRKDHRQTLTDLSVPVFMVGGEEDGAVLVDVIMAQAALPAQNTLHLYPKTGHMAVFENTAQLICDLVRFYKTV